MVHKFGSDNAIVLKYRKLSDNKIAELLQQVVLLRFFSSETGGEVELTVAYADIKSGTVPTSFTRPALPVGVEIVQGCSEVGFFRLVRAETFVLKPFLKHIVIFLDVSHLR